MSNINDGFKPIIPNIVDASMRESVNTNKLSSVKTVDPNKIVKNAANINLPKDNYKKYIQQGLMYVLIIVIIILLIILIYQMYIYFTVDDKLEPDINNIKDIHITNTNTIPVETEPSIKSERNLDNRVVDQTTKKIVEDNNVNSSRMVGQHVRIEEVQENTSNESNDYLQSILNKMNNSETVMDNDIIPSRDDMTSDLLNEMKQEKKLAMIEEEPTVDIITEFEDALNTRENNDSFINLEDDNDAESEDDNDAESNENFNQNRCTYILTRGRNKGALCNKLITSGTRCKQHDKK